MSNLELIERFYTAFDAHDGETMAASYQPDASFEDPAFGKLSGEDAGDMWRMLTSRAKSLDVELAEHEANDSSGTAHWIARYPFDQTGRDVVNDIRASFKFRDGLIAEHVDDFSFWDWSRQALGLPGLLLGWTPILQGAVRRKALGRLHEFQKSEKTGTEETPR